MTPVGRTMMQMVRSFTKFERAMNPGTALSRPSAAPRGRADWRKAEKAGCRQVSRDRRSVVSGRKSGADMARLYIMRQPTV
jgi:hypothetical protein